MAEIIATFFFIFAVIDPIGSVPVYLEATKNFSKRERKSIAFRSSAIAFLVLLFFIIVGQLVLEAMDVSLAAFQISGGVILFLFALTMIFGSGKPETEKEMIKDYKNVLVFPLAIPSIASPGAIMAVVLLTDNNIYTLPQQAFTALLVLMVIFLTSLILLAAGKVQKFIGESGITIISKIMGLILASYATQSILSGLKEFFMN